MAEEEKNKTETEEKRRPGFHYGRALLCPYEFEDPAFRRAGRLPNLRYGDQVRAVWVTRYDFENDADIVNIMARSAESGFNTVFFQVRGNATSYYRSSLEPWSETYDWQSPGYDPLLLAIQEAHARNMSLHAWINVMPMWRGSFPPSNKHHLYWTHSDWSWYDKHGGRQPLNKGFYVSINPCLPEARNHIVEVCREIVSGYEIDGLHLDYIRFPNEPPVVNGEEYPHDKRTLDLFRSDTGFTVEEKPNLWDQWRSDCVTALVRDIRRTAKSVRPQIVLTAAVGAERLNALSHFQDVEKWWKERLLDAVVPMNYTGCQRTFRRRVEHEWLVRTKENLILPLTRMLLGQEMWPANHKKHGLVQLVSDDSYAEWSRPPAPAIVMGTSVEFGDSRLHQKQLALALQRFGHFSVFSYSSLYGEGIYEERLRPLHLFLRILAGASKVSLSTVGSRLAHPFRYRMTNAHPEEAGPCDYQYVRDPVESSGAITSLDPVAVRWRSRRKGKRFISGDDEHPKKQYRRTTRRRLLVKDRRRKGRIEQKHIFGDSNQSLQVGSNLFERTGVMMEMKNWEAVRMSEATIGEEEHIVQCYPIDGLLRNLQNVGSFQRTGSGTIAAPTSPLCALSAPLITSDLTTFSYKGRVSCLSKIGGAVLESMGREIWSRLGRREALPTVASLEKNHCSFFIDV